MSALFLARHAETIWHAENRYAGSSDIELSETGYSQSASLAKWTDGRAISAIYSSDASRSRQTATPAATRLGFDLEIDSRLREVDFGCGEGMTSAEVRKAFPSAFAEYRLRPATSPLPGAESGEAAIDRVWPALQEISARHPATPPLVVMHSTLMRLVLCRGLGIDLDRYRSAFPVVLNAAITTVWLSPSSLALRGFNLPTSGSP